MLPRAFVLWFSLAAAMAKLPRPATILDPDPDSDPYNELSTSYMGVLNLRFINSYLIGVELRLDGNSDYLLTSSIFVDILLTIESVSLSECVLYLEMPLS